MKLLHIDSSILANQSVSRRLTARVVADWKAAYPDTTVEYLDLAQDTPPHVGSNSLALRQGLADANLSAEQKAENVITEKLLQQFLSADVVVIGAPMYNFAIPSQLKVWLDRLAQPGRTFRYTEKGPEGLAKGKRIIVASSRAGMYSAEGMRAMDHQESYLSTIFGFFGVNDVQFVRAEGLAFGETQKAEAISKAEAHISQLVEQNETVTA